HALAQLAAQKTPRPLQAGHDLRHGVGCTDDVEHTDVDLGMLEIRRHIDIGDGRQPYARILHPRGNQVTELLLDFPGDTLAPGKLAWHQAVSVVDTCRCTSVRS